MVYIKKMFVRSGKVQGKYVSLVCRATIDAKKRFLDASRLSDSVKK